MLRFELILKKANAIEIRTPVFDEKKIKTKNHI